MRRRRRDRYERVERIEQGERGKTGDPGDPGPPGPPGPAQEVVHDEARERKRDRRALYRAAQLVAIPVSVVLLAAVVGMGLAFKYVGDQRVREREQTTYSICLESQKNRNGIRTAIVGGDPSKLKPGDYGYSYSREHPAETAKAHRDIVSGQALALKRFPPLVCVRPGGRPRSVTTTERTP